MIRACGCHQRLLLPSSTTFSSLSSFVALPSLSPLDIVWPPCPVSPSSPTVTPTAGLHPCPLPPSSLRGLPLSVVPLLLLSSLRLPLLSQSLSSDSPPRLSLPPVAPHTPGFPSLISSSHPPTRPCIVRDVSPSATSPLPGFAAGHLCSAVRSAVHGHGAFRRLHQLVPQHVLPCNERLRLQHCDGGRSGSVGQHLRGRLADDGQWRHRPSGGAVSRRGVPQRLPQHLQRRHGQLHLQLRRWSGSG